MGRVVAETMRSGSLLMRQNSSVKSSQDRGVPHLRDTYSAVLSLEV
jgi:hypothetical protein